MNNLLTKLFPEGQRKLLVSLIALVIGIVLEKFAGGLTDNMQQSLIAIVAIFTGGNVMEHLANALKIVKGTKVGQIIEDVIPGDQGLGADPAPVKTAPAPVEQQEEEPVEEYVTAPQFRTISEVQNRQAQNIADIVKHINQLYGHVNNINGAVFPDVNRTSQQQPPTKQG